MEVYFTKLAKTFQTISTTGNVSPFIKVVDILRGIETQCLELQRSVYDLFIGLIDLEKNRINDITPPNQPKEKMDAISEVLKLLSNKITGYKEVIDKLTIYLNDTTATEVPQDENPTRFG